MTIAGPTAPAEPAPPRRRRAWLGRAALAALALVVLLVVFQSAWLPPLIRHVVRERSGRAIDFSAIHFGLDRALRPWVGFDDLRVENADWARSREPLIRGRKVVFEFDWQGLSTGVWQIRRLVLEDAAVDLERRADGLRNSRLWHPDRTGAGRTRVLRIDALRSRLGYADAVADLQLQITSVPLAAPRPLAGHPGLMLTQRLSFEGRRAGTAFAGTADVGDFVTLQRSAEAFPLAGDIHAENLRLAGSGRVADVLVDGSIEADLQFAIEPQAGSRAAPFAGVPAGLRMTADGHLSRAGSRWTVSAAHLRSARSEMVGTLEYRHGGAAAEARSTLRGAFDSPRLDLREAHPGGPPPAAAPPPSSRPRTLDAEIDVHAARLDWGDTELAREARLHASLDHDRLGLRLAEAQVAAGRASGEWHLDLSRSPGETTLEVQLSGLQLDRLPKGKPNGALRGGRLDGRAALRAQGRATAELLASASGRIEGSLHGATVSRRLEAELGLDGLGLLRSVVGGPEQVPLRCAELSVDVQRGIATVDRLTIDTPRTAVAGRGSVDLARRSVDLVLSPSSNVGALLALPRDIHVTGRLDAPKVSLQERRAAATPRRCAG